MGAKNKNKNTPVPQVIEIHQVHMKINEDNLLSGLQQPFKAAVICKSVSWCLDQAKTFAHIKPTLPFPDCCLQLCYIVSNVITFREETAAVVFKAKS